MVDIEKLVNEKNQLVKDLHKVLAQLSDVRVDMLCDSELRLAVAKHPAIDLNEIKIKDYK